MALFNIQIVTVNVHHVALTRIHLLLFLCVLAFSWQGLKDARSFLSGSVFHAGFWCLVGKRAGVFLRTTSTIVWEGLTPTEDDVPSPNRLNGVAVEFFSVLSTICSGFITIYVSLYFLCMLDHLWLSVLFLLEWIDEIEVFVDWRSPYPSISFAVCNLYHSFLQLHSDSAL